MRSVLSLRPVSGPVAFLALLAAAGCDLFSGGEVRGGGGFEGETITLAGQMLYPDGSPASGARVRLRPEGYTQSGSGDAVYDTVSDPDGRFALPGIPEGAYLLESFDAATRAVQIPLRVESPGPGDTVVALPPDTLRLVGALRGKVARATGDTGALPSGRVLIAGLDRQADIAADGSFLIGDLPSGPVDLRVILSNPPAVRRLKALTIASGKTTEAGILVFTRQESEDYSTWPSSRRILLNTTIAGAGLEGDVTAYPLLVRLDSSTFDFDRAAHPDDGADLRFSKADGTPLPFELESWDAAARRAAFWVRLDTVYANRSDQAVVLHWGRPDVFGLSNPAAVFNPADGFAGVWHLDQEAGTDATGISAPGRNYGTIPLPGLAGSGRRFDGIDAVSIPDGPALRPAAFTLSCWAYRDGSQVPNGKLLYKGIRVAPFASYTLDFRRPAGGLTFKTAKTDGTDRLATDPGDMPDRAWVHAAATFDPATGEGILYVDGSAVKTFTHAGAVRYFDGDSPLFIGNETAAGKPNRTFLGLLDEARLSRTALPARRLKLDFESQRPDSRLLSFP